MEEKFYQFLLLDKENIQKSTKFVEYTSGEMYDKLKAKYKNMLSILEYILKLAEMKAEEYDDNRENLPEIECKNKMNRIIQQNNFSDKDIKMFEKYMHGNANDGEKNHILSLKLEELEKLVEYEALKLQANFESEKYEKCRSVIRYINDLKKMFYGSYGFNSIYENREWKNACEQQTELLQEVLYRFYTLETYDSDETNLDEENEAENEIDFIQPHHIFVFDQIIQITRDIGDIVDESDKFKKNWKIQRLEYSYGMSDIAELIEFYMDIDEKRAAGALSKSDESEVQECIVSAIRKIEKIGRSEVAFLGEIFPQDAVFLKYKKLCEQLSESIKLYDSNKSGKLEHFDNEEDRIKNRKLRDAQKKTRDAAYRQMKQVLIDMELRKKDALDKIIKRIEYKKKYVKADYYNRNDISLYKTLLNALRTEVRNIYKKSEGNTEEKENPMRENRNQIFQYKDKVIVTLTFPNTDIEKFKTAAFIVDAQDLKKVYVDSGKCAWTYKHSRKAPEKEYDKKTLKPDKITTKGGSMDLLQTILGDYEPVDDKRVYYVTESHKFDARKKYIKKVDKLTRKVDSNYHQGRIRINESNISETVCFNNANNETDASILYFDDMNRLANFLDNMQ